MWREGKKLAKVARLWALNQLNIKGDHETSEATLEKSASNFGLQIVDEPDDQEQQEAEQTFHLWPCNVEVYNIWCQIQTQWNVSMEGRTGLRYESVHSYLRNVLQIKQAKATEIFRGLQAMEQSALIAWKELASERHGNHT